MKQLIISIGRESGSGGHEIAEQLAQRFSLTAGLMLATACVVLRAPLVNMFINPGESEAVRTMAEMVMIVLGVLQPLRDLVDLI